MNGKTIAQLLEERHPGFKLPAQQPLTVAQMLEARHPGFRMTPEPAGPGALDTVRHAAGQAVHGALDVQDSVDQFGRGLVSLFGKLDPRMGVDLPPTPPVSEMGARQAVESALPTQPALEGSLPLTKAPRFVGSAVPYAAAALLSGGAMAPMALGVVQAGGQSYGEAKAMGADDDTAFTAAAANMGVAAALAPVMGRLFSRINLRSGGKLDAAWKDVGKSSLEGGAAMTAFTGASNVIAEHTYDAEREWYDGLVDSGLTGMLGVIPIAAAGRWANRGANNRYESEMRAVQAAEIEQARAAMPEAEVLPEVGYLDTIRKEVEHLNEPYLRARSVQASLGRNPTTYELEKAGGLTREMAKEMRAALEEQTSPKLMEELRQSAEARRVAEFEASERARREEAAARWQERGQQEEAVAELYAEQMAARAAARAAERELLAASGEAEVRAAEKARLAQERERLAAEAADRAANEEWYTRNVAERVTPGEMGEPVDKPSSYSELGAALARRRGMQRAGAGTEPTAKAAAEKPPVDPIVVAEMPKGRQIGTDLTGEPVYEKVERGDAERPGAGIEQPHVAQPGIFDEVGGLFETQAYGTEKAAPTAADTARQRALDTGKLQAFVRARGGIKYDTHEGRELHGVFSNKEHGSGSFGLGPLVHGPKSAKGAHWERLMQEAVEAGFFPGKSAGEISYADFFDALSKNVSRPEHYKGPAGDTGGGLGWMDVKGLLGLPRLRPRPGRPAVRSAASTGDPGVLASEVPESRRTARPADPVQGGTSAGEVMLESDPLGLDPLTGTTERALEGNVATTSKIEVFREIQSLAQDFKLPMAVRWGASAQGTRGHFDPATNAVRVNASFSLPTTLHEVAHGLHKMVSNLEPMTEQRIGKAAYADLDRLGKRLYRDVVPNGGYAAEGFAESLKLYMMAPEWLKANAPDAFRFVQEDFLMRNRAVGERVEGIQKLVSRWRFQGSLARGHGSRVDPASVEERMRSIKQKVAGRAAHRQFLDENDALAAIDRLYTKVTGEKLPVGRSPSEVKRALQATSQGVLDTMIRSNMVNFARQAVGPSLRQALAPASGQYDLFATYGHARRAMKLWTSSDPRNPALALADAEAIVHQVERDAPQIALAFDNWLKWHDGLLDYVAQSSPTAANLVEMIRKNDAGDYFRLEAFFDESEKDSMRFARGISARGDNIVQKLKGSGRPRVDPMPSMISDASRLVRWSHDRLVLDTLAPHAHEPWGNTFIQRLSPDEAVRAVSKEAQQFADKLDESIPLEDRSALAEFYAAMSEDPVAHGKTPRLRLYEPHTDAKGRQHKWAVYDVDPAVYDAATNHTDLFRLPWAMELFTRVPRHTFAVLNTAASSAFTFAKVPFYDLPTMYLSSRGQKGAVDMLRTWVSAAGESFLTSAAGMDVNRARKAFSWTGLDFNAMDAYLRLGMESTELLKDDLSTRARLARRAVSGYQLNWAELPRSAADLYNYAINVIASPMRASNIAEMKAVADKVGWDMHGPLSVEQMTEILNSTKRVTGDRTTAGTLVKWIDRVAPFARISVAAPRDTLVGAYKDHPQRFVARGLGISGAALALWWTFKDEEWWKNMTARERATHLPVPIPGTDQIIMIPMTNELMMSWVGLPIMLADAAYQEDPGSVVDMLGEGARRQIPAAPPLIEEALEQSFNEDTYTNQPIDRMGGPEEQHYNEMTSKAAITIGRWTGLSPLRIDHAIRGLGGRVATDFLELTGKGPAGFNREWQPSDIPVWGGLFRKGGKYANYTRDMEAMYDLVDRARTNRGDRFEPETEDERTRRMILEDASLASSMLTYYARRAEKQDARDALIRERDAIVKQTLEAVESPTAKRLWGVHDRGSALERQKSRETKALHDLRAPQ